MIIRNLPLSWYVDRLRSADYFSQGMYGDGEWLAIIGQHVGKCNAESTDYSPQLCYYLKKSLKYRHDNYLFSVPETLKDTWIGQEAARLAVPCAGRLVEKDLPWDVETRTGGLVAFIRQLQQMKVCVIGNRFLRALTFLNYDQFIEVSYPNCYPEIPRIMARVREIGGSGRVYVVSMGLPAALVTQQIHGLYPDVFALDVGSIWDAFAGIGGQRGWRKNRFQHPELYREWLGLYAEVLDDWKPPSPLPLTAFEPGTSHWTKFMESFNR